jgi:hypothetical protein
MENELIRVALKKEIRGTNLDEQIQSYLDLFESERAHNELRKPIISEIEYLKKDIELGKMYNDILLLQQIKLKREYGRHEDNQG